MGFWGKTELIAGKSPGTIVPPVKDQVVKSSLRLVKYNTQSIVAENYETLSELGQHITNESINWIQFEGLHDLTSLMEASERFDIHPLVLEDIANMQHTPKVNGIDGNLFFILKEFAFEWEQNVVSSRHMGLLVLREHNVLISFSHTRPKISEMIEERLLKKESKTRQKDIDYLLYTIIDGVVDQHMVAVEKMSEKLSHIEESIILNPEKDVLKMILGMKKALLYMRNSVTALKDFVDFPEKHSPLFFKKNKKIFLKDVSEHISYIKEISEHTLSMMDTLMDLFYSSTSYKMNEVIKVLTIISTLFIPLSFIVGLYGMNFHNMPELAWKYGYFVVLGIIAVIIFGMIIFFKKKKWI